jgi:hypothetical protein
MTTERKKRIQQKEEAAAEGRSSTHSAAAEGTHNAAAEEAARTTQQQHCCDKANRRPASISNMCKVHRYHLQTSVANSQNIHPCRSSGGIQMNGKQNSDKLRDHPTCHADGGVEHVLKGNLSMK